MDDDTEREAIMGLLSSQINCWVDGLLHLWRHVAWRPGVGIGRVGHTEVNDDGVILPISSVDHDVVGLEISMSNVILMQELDAQ